VSNRAEIPAFPQTHRADGYRSESQQCQRGRFWNCESDVVDSEVVLAGVVVGIKDTELDPRDVPPFRTVTRRARVSDLDVPARGGRHECHFVQRLPIRPWPPIEQIEAEQIERVAERFETNGRITASERVDVDVLIAIKCVRHIVMTSHYAQEETVL
jgi:hypothetical protein